MHRVPDAESQFPCDERRQVHGAVLPYPTLYLTMQGRFSSSESYCRKTPINLSVVARA